MKTNYSYTKVDENGFYGNYGGAYVPEILYKTVEDLKRHICLSLKVRNSRKNFTFCYVITWDVLPHSTMLNV